MAKVATQAFLTDIKTLSARKHIEDGAVTAGYQADRTVVIKLLNEALATKPVCILRYKRHYFMANGINAGIVAQEFLQHANEGQLHADRIAARIVQLRGRSQLQSGRAGDALACRACRGRQSDRDDPGGPDRRAHRHRQPGEMIRHIGDKDITTRRMLEGILAMDGEHADNLSSQLGDLDC